MKKSLGYLALLVLVLFIADRLLSFSLDTIIGYSNFRYVNLFKEEPDIYVLGNSRGVFSVMESEFDRNFDFDVLNISFTRLNSESIHYLTKSVNKNKLLFIEVSSFLGNDSEVREHNISPIFRSIKGLRKQDYSVKDNFLNLFKTYNFNNRTTLRLFYHLLKSDKNWTQRRVINQSILQKLESVGPNTLNINPQFFDYLSFLKNNGYNYVFYHAPYHPLYQKKIENMAELNNELKSILGNRFLDLTHILEDDVYFADGVHSNFNAVGFIHSAIVDYIDQHSEELLIPQD